MSMSSRIARMIAVPILLLLGGQVAAAAEVLYPRVLDDMVVPDAQTELPDIPIDMPVKFIYIAFPGLDCSAEYPANRADIQTNLDDYFFEMSGGTYDFYSTILANPDSTKDYWMADYPVESYVNRTAWTEHWNYLCGSRNYLGEIQSEILHKIDAAYSGQTSPFTDVGMFVFIYNGKMIMGAGGYGYNAVILNTFDFLQVMDTTLESVVCSILSGVCALPGAQFEDVDWLETQSGTISPATQFDVPWTMTHELGHYFGLRHPYSGVCYDAVTGGSIAGSLYTLKPEFPVFGPYSQVRMTMQSGVGSVPYHPVYLEKLGWVEAIEVSESVEGFVLGDVRLDHQIVKIEVPNSPDTWEWPEYGASGPIPPQYFYLSYHGGNGYDVRLKEDGTTVYPSRGLAIWHGSSDVNTKWDLESAWGMYADPDTVDPGPGVWSVPDAVNGYDNMDCWVNYCTDPPDTADYGVLETYFYDYPGSSKDFFGAMSGKDTFSYWTNPNTYAEEGPIGQVHRLAQSIPTSMIITIEDETSDQVVLNILFAPYEKITYPNGGEEVAWGQPTDITWEKQYTVDQPDGIIDLVDIYLDPGPGLDSITIVEGWQASLGSYEWTPLESHATTEGKIRIVYHNVNDLTHVGEDESNAVFSVGPPLVAYSDKSSDTELAYDGQPYSTALLDSDGAGPMDMFISFSADWPGKLYTSTVLNPESQSPEFQNATSTSFQGSAPPNNLLGIAVADFDNDGHDDMFVASETDPRLYRFDDATDQFQDVTQAMGLNVATYSSITGAWGDYDRDGWVDLYVARGQCWGDPLGGINWVPNVMLRNETHYGNGFADVTTQVGILPETPTLGMSVAWGDFNNDLWPDLFVGYQSEQVLGVPNETSILYINQNGHLYNQSELRLGAAASYGVNGVSWADMNNDGFMDIVTSNHYGPSVVFFGDAQGYCQSKKYFQGLASIGGHMVFDNDLDGRSDILFYPSEDTANLVLMGNRSTLEQAKFSDLTGSVGLASPGATGGGIAADFNGDGDYDLLLGRRAIPLASNPAALHGKLFFKATQANVAIDGPVNNWLSVQLSSPYGFNNTKGIGARVTIYEGMNQYTKIGDGGHGRGESNGPEMLFGLGGAANVDSVVVVWPRGTRQVISGGSVTLRQPLIVEDSTTLEILSPSGYYKVIPATTLLDYTFTWKTTTWATDSLDQVEVEGIGACGPSFRTLTPTSSGVEHSVVYQSGEYIHTMVWRNQVCTAGCSVEFRVKSEVEGVVSTWGVPRTFPVSVCSKKLIFHEE
jgi:enediyne biosynthesis protein E4